MTPRPTDTLTFLSSAQTVATKTHHPGGVLDYAIGSGPFQTRRINVDDLDAVAQAVMACPADTFHVRGKPKALIIPYRRHRAQGDEPPSLEAEAHHVLPIDIDGNKDGRDGRQIVANAEYWRSMLPAPFTRARCFAQATSSAGVKPGSRLRLWFWLAQPIHDRDAKLWLQNCGADTSIYTPSQPIYCAPPRFDRVPDPFAELSRYAWLEGTPAVELPSSFESSTYVFDGVDLAQSKLIIGTRNTKLTSLAGAMRRRGCSEAAILAGLQEQNKEFSPPLEPEEVAAIARSVARYEPEIAAALPLATPKKLRKDKREVKERLRADATLLPKAAALLKPHVDSGGLTEQEAISCLMDGVSANVDHAVAVTRGEVAKLLSEAPPLDKQVPAWAQGFVLSDEGQPISCPENLRVLLASHHEFSLWYDLRNRRQMWAACPWRKPGPVESTDDFALRAWLSRELRWHRSPAEPLAAFAQVASTQPWDLWAEYLKTLQWDGVPRLERAAHLLLGAPDTPISTWFFTWWLVSAVARTFRPGCQVDHVLVLEGGQGIGKTSFLRSLAFDGAYFTRFGAHVDLASPRTIAKIHGPVIVELAELASLKRAEIESIKAFLDETCDRVQFLYSRMTEDVPRTCVFAATTNESEYLRDPTGNRRFWPLQCPRIDLAALLEHRVQLWAEAVALFNAGMKWWPTPQEAQDLGIAEVQTQRREYNPNTDLIVGVLDRLYKPGPQMASNVTMLPEQLTEKGTLKWLTMQQLCGLLNTSVQREGRALAHSLRDLGWFDRRTASGSLRIRAWYAPGER